MFFMPLISQLTPPQLESYLDYRKFLADFFEFKKNQHKTHKNLRSYQYSDFAAAADIKSPNYLKMIIEGKRNLSEEMALKFAKAMHLTKNQSEEFKHLVFLNQATDPAVRNQHLRDLNDHRMTSSIVKGQLDSKTCEKIPNWIGWILYAMLDQENVNFNLDELKFLLRKKAKESEIEAALEKLLKSGEIVIDPATGIYKKGRSLIEKPEDIPVSLIRKLQAQLMYLGLESLFQDQATDREFGTLTLCLTQKEFEDLKFQLRKMRKQIHKDNSVQRMSSKGDRVYQLNLQLFPVTEKMEIKKGIQPEFKKTIKHDIQAEIKVADLKSDSMNEYKNDSKIEAKKIDSKNEIKTEVKSEIKNELKPLGGGKLLSNANSNVSALTQQAALQFLKMETEGSQL